MLSDDLRREFVLDLAKNIEAIAVSARFERMAAHFEAQRRLGAARDVGKS